MNQRQARIIALGEILNRADYVMDANAAWREENPEDEAQIEKALKVYYAQLESKCAKLERKGV